MLRVLLPGILLSAVLLPCRAQQVKQLAEKDPIQCPPNTERVLIKTSEEVARKPYYAQAEEYCCSKGPNDTFVKHGPYILWGPNGERLEEGTYVNGQKDGKWTYRRPSQTVEETWKKGTYVEYRILPRATAYVIDFAAAVPHKYGIPAGLGSTTYEVLGKEGEFCRFKYQIEIERGRRPWVTCLVPTRLGKVVFQNTNMGLDFSALKPYVQQTNDQK